MGEWGMKGRGGKWRGKEMGERRVGRVGWYFGIVTVHF